MCIKWPVCYAQDAISLDDKVIPNPPRVPLSSAHVDRHGAYLMDMGTHMYLWIGAAISDQFCVQVLDCPSYQSMPDTMVLLAVISACCLHDLVMTLCNILFCLFNTNIYYWLACHNVRAICSNGLHRPSIFRYCRWFVCRLAEISCDHTQEDFRSKAC